MPRNYAENNTVATARAKGEYWKANLLEAEARGRYVHAQPKRQFPHLDGIEDCDFTAAHLHACQFVGCLDPYRRSREYASILWPREIRAWFTAFDRYPETTVAMTYSAATLAKEAGVIVKVTERYR